MQQVKRFCIIGCDILRRELYYHASRSPSRVDVIILPKRLHDLPTGEMSQKIQSEIDLCEGKEYDAILLAYGRCNDGSAGLRAGDIPLVIFKATDCISVLLGSEKRYREYFFANPGTYFKSMGWSEWDISAGGESGDEWKTIPSRLGIITDRDEISRNYGEENADYLMEFMGSWLKHYSRITYIKPDFDGPDCSDEARETASDHSLEYGEIEGSTVWIRDLIDGNWDEDRFQIIPPGRSTAPAPGSGTLVLGE